MSIHPSMQLKVLLDSWEARQTILLATDLSTVDWTGPHLQVGTCLHHHLVATLLEVILPVHSEVALPHHLCRLSTSLEDPCLDTHLLPPWRWTERKLEMVGKDLHQVSTEVHHDLRPWTEDMSMLQLRPHEGVQSTQDNTLSTQVNIESESEMIGNDENELREAHQVVPDPIQEDHRLDCPSTERPEDIISLHLGSHLILVITVDTHTPKARKVIPCSKACTRMIPDTTLDESENEKGMIEWMGEVHRKRVKILEHTRQPHRQRVEYRQRESRRKTKHRGRGQSDPRTNSSRRAKRLPLQTVTVTETERTAGRAVHKVLLPLDLLSHPVLPTRLRKLLLEELLTRVSSPIVQARDPEADLADYDDGAGAVDALMSLHSDRRSEPRSGSQSPVNPMSAATGGIKRSASPPKQDSLESVKRAKNSGSDSPARRTVIEVLNTPNVDSPLAKTDGASGSEGYYKGTTDKQPSDAPDTPKVPEEVKEDAKQGQTPDVSAPAAKEVAQETPATADPSRPDTPPMEAAPATPAPDAAPAANEDVTMAESDAPAAPESTTEPAAAAPSAPSPAPEPATAAATETVPAIEKEAETEKTETAQPMDVDPTPAAAPAESTEAPSAPAPATTTSETAEPASEAATTATTSAETNEEKKEE